MEEKIFKILVEDNEVTWKDIIFDLIKQENMDPWDVNVSILTKKYISMLKKMKGLDFKISGKVVFAAAILLKAKSKRLVGDDLDEFDRLLASGDEPDEAGFYEDLAMMRDASQIPEEEMLKLIPRTPQPRKRKVSVYDLVNALEKALEVKKRRIIRSMPKLGVEMPEKSRDINLVIKQIYNKILDFFLSNPQNRLKFTNLVPSEEKLDKVFTFIPLLHLANQRKVDLVQHKHFGDIDVRLLKSIKPVEEQKT
jgi:segregation and condensation protein A